VGDRCIHGNPGDAKAPNSLMTRHGSDSIRCDYHADSDNRQTASFRVRGRSFWMLGTDPLG